MCAIELHYSSKRCSTDEELRHRRHHQSNKPAFVLHRLRFYRLKCGKWLWHATKENDENEIAAATDVAQFFSSFSETTKRMITLFSPTPYK